MYSCDYLLQYGHSAVRGVQPYSEQVLRCALCIHQIYILKAFRCLHQGKCRQNFAGVCNHIYCAHMCWRQSHHRETLFHDNCGTAELHVPQLVHWDLGAYIHTNNNASTSHWGGKGVQPAQQHQQTQGRVCLGPKAGQD